VLKEITKSMTERLEKKEGMKMNTIKIETDNIKLELEVCCEDAVKAVESFAALIHGIEKEKKEK